MQTKAANRPSDWAGGRRWIGIGLAAAAILLLGLVGRSLATLVPTVAARVERLGDFAPVAFILVYAVAEVAFVPGSLLTLAAGALFGVGWGTLFAMVGATLGASAAFLVGRYGVRRLVEKRVRSFPKLAALDAALASEGRWIVFLVRLTPLIPFNALNYALGVTRVRFVDYLVGSIGMLPGALLYAYYGHIAGSAALVATGAAEPRNAAYYGMLAVGLVTTLALTIVIARAARRALTASTSRKSGARPDESPV